MLLLLLALVLQLQLGHYPNHESNELLLLRLESFPCLLDQLVHYRFCQFDEAVIRRRIGGAPLGARLLPNCSAVVFSFPEGGKDMTLDSRSSNMCGGYSLCFSKFIG